MNKELVTIGIPVYNMADSIVAAVNSCLNQTYDNIEVLLVDDGSDDDGIARVRQNITDPRVRILVRPENGGVSAAMCDLVDNARGEYICFLDADDTMMPTRVARQYAAIQEARAMHPNRMVASFCGSLVNDITHGTQYTINPNNLWHPCARDGFGGGTGHAMYRVADIRALGNFDRRLSRSADGALCVLFLIKGGFFAMVDEPLITYNFVWNQQKQQAGDADRKIFNQLRHQVVAENPRNMYLRRFAGISGESGKTRFQLFGLVPLVTMRHRVDEYGTRRTWVRLFDFIPVLKIKQ